MSSFRRVVRAAPPAGGGAGRLRVWLAERIGGEGRRSRDLDAAPAGAAERGSAGGDQHVLLAVDRVDAGRVVDAAVERLLPEHLPGLGVERLEVALAAD